MMNKKQLVEKISAETKATKRQTSKFLDKMIDIVTNELEKGEEVKIVGFGTFSTKTREPHRARNPKTKETIFVDRPRRFVKFKCSNMITDRINNTDEK